MTKEVLVFTDDVVALRPVDSSSAYGTNSEIAEQVERVYSLYQILHDQGIHLELCYSPGHAGVPGNQAADAEARRYQMQLLWN